MYRTRQLFDGHRRATTVWQFFQETDISKNIFPFPMSPAINDTLRTYRLMQEIASSREKSGRRRQLHFRPLGIRRARAKVGGDWTRHPGDPLLHTTDKQTHKQTDRQLLLYIEIHFCLQSHGCIMCLGACSGALEGKTRPLDTCQVTPHVPQI